MPYRDTVGATGDRSYASNLKQDILEKQKELELLEKKLLDDSRSLAIKGLDEFTDEEKISIFDKLYSFNLSVINDIESSGYINEDTDHWAYETLMEIMARDRSLLWKYLNKLTR